MDTHPIKTEKDLTKLNKKQRKLKITKRNVGLEILEGLKEIKSHKKDRTKLKTTKLQDTVGWVEPLLRNPT